MDHQIIHYPERSCFETEVDGYTAGVEYILRNGQMIIIHTYVPKPIGGKGIASDLVQTAYDYCKEKGMKIGATCSYADIWLSRNAK